MIKISTKKNTFFSKVKGGLIFALALPFALEAQNSFTFTSCGATGINGPTQLQANTAYTSTSLSGSVTVTAGIQNFTVPVSGPYRITAIGAQGGYGGGYGANIAGDFTLAAGTVLKIVVGQQGTQGTNSAPYSAGGGGGGSFISSPTNVPYIVAGGGGGNGGGYTGTPVVCCLNGMQASTTNAGNPYPSGANGGTAGNGGNCGSYTGGGGAGFYGNGSLCNAGIVASSFTAGAVGGTGYAFGGTLGNGGFGGGGGHADSGTGMRGGGGGGYSGGGGGVANSGNDAAGGGGGSYNSGANQTNSVATTGGDGKVIIDLLCNINLLAATTTSSNLTNPSICSGSSVTLTTNGVSNYNWSTGNTTNSVIVVTPSVTTTYTLSATQGTVNCTAYNAITIIVNGTVPSLSINASTTNTCQGTSVVLTASGALTYSWTGGVTNAVPFTPLATSGYTVTGQNGCGTSSLATTVSISPLPVSAITSTNTVCAGTTATLTANSAVSGFTWQPSSFNGSVAIVSPAVNTIYTVTASNGTCNGTATVSVNAIPKPTVSIVVSNFSVCSGESSTLTASGGSSYNWSTGSNAASIVVSPGIPTQYSVTASNAQGCLSGTTAIILANPSPTIFLSANNNIICNGGSAILSVSGASTYVWDNSATTTSIVVNPLTSTTYSVIGTGSNLCQSAPATINIDVFSPTVGIAGNTTICEGSSTNLNAVSSASNSTTYTWSPNSVIGNGISVSPSTNTTYTVNALTTASAGGVVCPSSSTVQVMVNPLPTITAGSTKTLICKGESVTFTCSGASTYTWNTGVSTANSSTVTATPTIVTTLVYTVTGTDTQGCINSKSAQVKVDPCNGLLDASNNQSALLIFPNPNNGEFTIQYTSELELSIVSLTGQEVRKISLNDKNNFRYSTGNLSSGIYFVVGQSKNQSVKQKIVIN